MSKNDSKNKFSTQGTSKTSNMTAQEIEEGKQRLAKIQEVERLKDLEKLNEQKKLRKIKTNKEDIATLQNEFLLDRPTAIRALQQSGLESGTADLAAAMRTLVNALV